MKALQAHRIAGKPNFKQRIITNNQSAGDIVAALLYATRESQSTAEKLVKRMNLPGRSVYDNCQEIYDFIKRNIRYEKEPADNQTAKTLKRIFDPSEQFGDCKHYSTIAASLCKALGYKTYFRVINQTGRFNHIYCIVKTPKGQTVIIDPCYPYFDREANYQSKKDILI
jgi:transglutaminase-like putative cysteine protease